MSTQDVAPVTVENKSVRDVMNQRIPAATMPWLVFPRSLMELAASIGITFVGWTTVGVVIAAMH